MNGPGLVSVLDLGVDRGMGIGYVGDVGIDNEPDCCPGICTDSGEGTDGSCTGIGICPLLDCKGGSGDDKGGSDPGVEDGRKSKVDIDSGGIGS